MPHIVTSDEFITGVLCDLALSGERIIKLSDTSTDKRFAEAFELLVERMADLDIDPDFSLRTNPYHGDSETLRDTLYQIRERGVVALNNPSFKTVEFKLDDDEAEDYLTRSNIPRAFYDEIIAQYFLTDGHRAH